MPTANQLESLRARRDKLAALLEHRQAVAPADRSNAEVQEIEEMSRLVADIEALLRKCEPAPVTPRASRPAAAERSQHDGAVVLARIPKGKRAEMRVSATAWKGRRTVDIRLWYLPQGSDEEWAPSRKGVSVDASKLPALLDALHLAQQHTPEA